MIHFNVSPSAPVSFGLAQNNVSMKVEQGRVVHEGCDGCYQIGDGLKLDPETNILSVDTADAVEQDNTKPVTSAAVFTEVGNIEVLLAAL